MARTRRLNSCVPDKVNPSWQMPWASETAVFAVSGGVARGETLFDTRAERSERRADENPYTGSRFHCYSRPFLSQFLIRRGSADHCSEHLRDRKKPWKNRDISESDDCKTDSFMDRIPGPLLEKPRENCPKSRFFH